MPRTLEEAEKLLREINEAIEPYEFGGDRGEFNNEGVIESRMKIDEYFKEPSDVKS